MLFVTNRRTHELGKGKTAKYCIRLLITDKGKGQLGHKIC